MTKVAFVSFRLKAQDGVSVETEKWISVFAEWGFEICRLGGFIPEPDENDFVMPELNHQDPLAESFTSRVFSRGPDRHELQSELAAQSSHIERGLHAALAEISPDLIVAENVFSMPLNIPLTMVLCRYLTEEKVPAIAIHHDFHWEHERFGDCVLEELLVSHFPPRLPQIRHVTINDNARMELARRTGIEARTIRNCFDFESPRKRDSFNAGFRRDMEIGDDEILFLQPTRAIERKGISRAIGFVEEFAVTSGKPAALLITGSAEDGYAEKFERMCGNDSPARILHRPDWLGFQRGSPGARTPYDIHDAYAHCDLVTFPSRWEGFGNPVMESVVHRKPLIVDHYPVLDELRDFGFQFLSLDRHAVDRALKMLEYPKLMAEMAERNFEIGRKHFSMDRLRQELEELVASMVLAPRGGAAA